MPKSKSAERIEREGGREGLLLQMLTSDKIEISDEAMAHFRAHPEEVDEVTAATRVHRFFLWVGLGLGMLAVAVSRILSSLPLEIYVGPGIEGFLVDIVFEGGVALIGAALTAYFMGVLLNAQQARAKAFRREIRRRLREEAP